MKLVIQLERDQDNQIWGTIEDNAFLHSTVGNHVEEVTQNLRSLISDGIEAGELADFPEWKNVDVADLTFEYEYFLAEIFKQFSFLKISEVARRANMNPTLLHQYASGTKSASLNQAQKISTILHKLANEMLSARVVA